MNFFIILIIIGKSIGSVAFFSAKRGQQIFGLLASLLFRWEDRYGCRRRRRDLLGGELALNWDFFRKCYYVY